MTSDQYAALLQELAHVAALSDASGLLDHGRVKIGVLDALLEHDPTYNADLLQVRISLGTVAHDQREVITTALLEANYVNGYGGECVFSLMPGSDDAVVTLRLTLQPAMSPHELWQQLSDIANHAQEMWQAVNAAALVSPGAPSSGLHGFANAHV